LARLKFSVRPGSTAFAEDIGDGPRRHLLLRSIAKAGGVEFGLEPEYFSSLVQRDCAP